MAFIIVLFIFLSSCSSYQNPPILVNPQMVVLESPVTFTLTFTKTQLPAFTTTAPPEETQHPAQTATAVVDFQPMATIDLGIPTQRNELTETNPLQLVFPSTAPAPISAWRPPLYPLPWAPTAQDHFYFARPIAADEVNWPLADYRYGGVFFEDVVHTGVDISAPNGTPVLSAGDGKVIWAGYGLYGGNPNGDTDPYGLAVVIRHNFGFSGKQLFTIYGHLQRIDIDNGELVTTGAPLGLVGATGKVTGPHLHFEVRSGESDFFTSYNPELWLVPPTGWGVLVIRMESTGGATLHSQKIYIESLQSNQFWRARTYGVGAVNADPYYQENLVVSDLPHGNYLVFTDFAGRSYEHEFIVYPGMVTFLGFQGRNGFNDDLP